MKKGIVSVTVLVIGFIALLSAYMMSSTYAKYTEEFAGASSTASIAKWDFNVVNNVDLFSESKIMNYDPAVSNMYKCVIDGTPPEDCVYVSDKKNTAVNEGFVAPGTSGEYKFKIKNLSDVKYRIAKVSVTGVDGTKGRINFCIDGRGCAQGIEGFNAKLAEVFDGTVVHGKTDKEYDVVHTIWWYWEFESSDDFNELDTDVGKDATKNATTNPVEVSLSVTITLDQATLS